MPAVGYMTTWGNALRQGLRDGRITRTQYVVADFYSRYADKSGEGIRVTADTIGREVHLSGEVVEREMRALVAAGFFFQVSGPRSMGRYAKGMGQPPVYRATVPPAQSPDVEVGPMTVPEDWKSAPDGHSPDQSPDQSPDVYVTPSTSSTRTTSGTTYVGPDGRSRRSRRTLPPRDLINRLFSLRPDDGTDDADHLLSVMGTYKVRRWDYDTFALSSLLSLWESPKVKRNAKALVEKALTDNDAPLRTYLNYLPTYVDVIEQAWWCDGCGDPQPYCSCGVLS